MPRQFPSCNGADRFTKAVTLPAPSSPEPGEVDIGAAPDNTQYVQDENGKYVLYVTMRNDKTTAPGVSDDATEGFIVGSVWVDTTNKKAYICIDDSSGAAVWKETTRVTEITVDSDTDPFWKLIGSATLGDLTKHIVSEGDVTIATVAGYAMVEVQDDGNQITDKAYYIPLYELT